MDEIKVGDIVRLKSGSPKYVVVTIDKDEANVVYSPFGASTKGHIMRQNVPLVALRKQS